MMRYVVAASEVQVTRVKSETTAIEGRASLWRPRVTMLLRSSAVRSFEVAFPEKAVTTWSAGMLEPLSWTLMDFVPPCSMEAVIRVVPALGVVFDEFLDQGGGAFHDLAGGDLGGDEGLQYLDVHGSSWSAEQCAAGKKLTTPLGWPGVSVETVGTI